MSAEWEKIILLSFGSSARLLMNEFFSKHMWIKETFDKTCIKDYNSIEKDQRHKKIAFYDKLFDQFLNLNIKRFYICKGKKYVYNFIFLDLDKKIVLLLTYAMGSNKIKVNKNICKYEANKKTLKY